MRYLCLIFTEAAQADAVERLHPLDALARAAYEQLLVERGQLVARGALASSDTAVTLRLHSGELSLAGGTAHAGASRLVAFYLLEARDLNDAIRAAAALPFLRESRIEVRPVCESNGGAVTWP